MNDEDQDRRLFLINKKYLGPGLSQEEQKELNVLDAEIELWLDEQFPVKLLTDAERNYLNEIISRAKL